MCVSRSGSKVDLRTPPLNASVVHWNLPRLCFGNGFKKPHHCKLSRETVVSDLKNKILLNFCISAEKTAADSRSVKPKEAENPS